MAEPAAAHIDRLVNTHSNPDHVLGNQLVADAEIISAKATAEAIAAMNPENFVNMTRNWQAMGEGGEFMYETMGRKFDFTGVTVTVEATDSVVVSAPPLVVPPLSWICVSVNVRLPAVGLSVLVS